MTQATYRPVDLFATNTVQLEKRGNSVYFQLNEALAPHPSRMAQRLIEWAENTPNANYMARRKQGGDWQFLTYAAALQAARSLGQALLNLGASADKPVLILSENSLEHAQLALACLLIGVPHIPASVPYSLVSQDFDKLKHIVNLTQPAFVFAQDARYEKAMLAIQPQIPNAQFCLKDGNLASLNTLSFEALKETAPTSAVEAAYAAITADTVTKYLFTSGSTKLPKAVINTNGMWCANQQQLRQTMQIITQAPPVLIDWLPWNHTFGGNHNVGIVLNNGGTMYIDDGKPTPALVGETLRNLKEISPTIYFNVPTGYEAIANAMGQDETLRDNFLKNVKMFFYAGASLPQPVWDALDKHSLASLGQKVVMTTGMGMTETSPAALSPAHLDIKAGQLGVPMPGLTIKLTPMGDKLELRYKGPNITPGYLNMLEESAEAFDEEGFFCSGDGVLWIDENNPNLGLRFDGRIAEDFKLATGTFVNVGPLRAKIIAAAAPYIQDVVITGINQKELGALLFPTAKIAALAELPATSPLAELVASPKVQAFCQELTNRLAATSTGSANKVARLILLDTPPSLDKGEVTDKGSINQRMVLKHRAVLVDAMYAGTAQGLITPKI